MANGASRLFNVMKQTSQDTNIKPSQVVSLTVKSVQPLIFIRDDKLEITKDFCIIGKLAKYQGFKVGDIVTATVFNEGQQYYIEQNDSSNLDIVSKDELDNELNSVKEEFNTALIDTESNIKNSLLNKVNYANDITNLNSNLEYNSNFQQIVKDSHNLVIINLTFDVLNDISLNSNTTIFDVPQEVIPTENIILFARSDYTLGICYMRLNGDVVVNFGKTISKNAEINIIGMYYTDIEEE